LPLDNQNVQSGQSDGNDTPGEEPRIADDLGSAYAALLSHPVWQVDGIRDLAEEPPPVMPSNNVEQEVQGNEENNDHACEISSPETIPLRRIVEALLFLGGEPISPEKACAAVRGLTPAELVQTIDGLNRDYRLQGRPYLIRPWKNGYELAIRPRYLPLVEKLQGTTREARLSPNAIDVLALVAYRQPIVKRDVDSLRGAESGALLRQLVRRGLLSVIHEESTGKGETVYRTTQRFLDLFQLRGPEDLPQTHDLQRL
jgi:segregation and condensation protein B